MPGRDRLVPGVRRLCLVVDVEKYSGRRSPAAVDVQDRLLWAMLQTCRVAEVDPARCARQDSGDGQLLVLPPGIDEGHVLPSAVRGLRSALHRLNARPGAGGRIRLRASLAQGLVHEAATGFVGAAVVHACRVLDSPQLRAALGARTDSDLALAVTDDLYQDVVTQLSTDPAAEQFAPLEVSVPGKGFRSRGWVYVPAPGAVRGLVPAYRGPVSRGGRPEHQACWGRTFVVAGAAVAAGAAVWGTKEAVSAAEGWLDDPGPHDGSGTDHGTHDTHDDHGTYAASGFAAAHDPYAMDSTDTTDTTDTMNTTDATDTDMTTGPDDYDGGFADPFEDSWSDADGSDSTL